MIAPVRPIDRCRACGSFDLEDLFSLGEQAVSGFPKPEDPETDWPPGLKEIEDGPAPVRCPIDLVRCGLHPRPAEVHGPVRAAVHAALLVPERDDGHDAAGAGRRGPSGDGASDATTRG
jgi:hypothetical protein